MTDPLNPEDFNERLNAHDERERITPRDSFPDIVSPLVTDHITAEGIGQQDVDIMHAFHRKYAHLFCMDDAEDGSEIYLFRKENRMWTNFNVREQIRSYVSTISTDLVRELLEVQGQLQTSQGEERETLSRRQAGIIKMIQRCGKAGTIGSIAGLLYDHLMTIHLTKRVVMNPNPMMLNCPNGAVDLNTGKIRLAQPDDYFTLNTGTVYDPDIDYSVCEKAVREIFHGNDEVYEFVHRWMGYSLTGLRRDHAIMILFGKGRNGKSLLIDALATEMGDYACKLPRGFMEKKNGGSDNNEQYAMADLNGARFAYASESGEGTELKAEMVKAITGDDTIKARHSHQNFKTFPITHKITLATNYKPQVNADDDAIWSRLFLTPTPARFGPAEEVLLGEANYLWDQKLLEKFKTPQGRSALLRWQVMGAMKYAQDGALNVPQVIRRQIARHRKDMDAIGTFVNEVSEYMEPIEVARLESLCGSGGGPEKREVWKAMNALQRCEVDKRMFYVMYRIWCKTMGIERPRTQLDFNRHMENNPRIWTDQEGDTKMGPMTLTGPPVRKWRWVKLTDLGDKLLASALGESAYDSNHRM